MKISGVYKITNTVTGDFYIGSSKDIKKRLAAHKCQSMWKKYPNKQLYQDMKRYGIDKFELQVLAEVEPDSLKVTEQQFIEKMHPSYNQMNAKGWDIEKRKEYQEEYQKNYKELHKNEAKEYQKNYKELHKNEAKEYQNQLCCYEGEILTLNALSQCFWKLGIDHPVLEAKKYII